MKKFLHILLLAVLVLSCERGTPPDPDPTDPVDPVDPTDSTYVVQVEAAVDITKTEPTQVLMHYYTWYQSMDIDKFWSVRWKMSNLDPENVDDNGKREIASHFYPTIGPYSSNDTLVLQLHALWMKYSGVDGISINWYGKSDFTIVRRATALAMEQFAQAGLSSSIMYDDKAVANAVAAHPTHDTALFIAQDLNELVDLSSLPYWTKYDNKPLFLVNGPSFARKPSTWTDALMRAQWRPWSFVGGGKAHRYIAGAGEYVWPWGGSGAHYVIVDDFYRTKPNLTKMGVLYPGFKDYYDEGGWSPGFDWVIEHHNGATMDSLVDLAQDYTFPFLQVATWNNFAEGTMVEPTDEFGTRFLEDLQEYTGAPYNAQDLDRCLRWFNASKQATSGYDKRICRQIYFELISLDTQAADALFDYLDE